MSVADGLLTRWKLHPGVWTTPTHPDLAVRVALLLAAPECADRYRIVSAARTYAQQKNLYDRWRAGTYRVPVVARPGTSKHEIRADGHSHAIDVDVHGRADTAEDRDLWRRLAPTYGLHTPVKSEWWHTEILPGWTFPALPGTPPNEDTMHLLIVDQIPNSAGRMLFAFVAGQHRELRTLDAQARWKDYGLPTYTVAHADFVQFANYGEPIS
jgi:hypothetical protein